MNLRDAAQPRMSGIKSMASCWSRDSLKEIRSVPSASKRRTYVQVTTSEDLATQESSRAAAAFGRFARTILYFDLPDAWIGTFKNTVHHAQWIVRIETSHSVELT